MGRRAAPEAGPGPGSSPPSSPAPVSRKAPPGMVADAARLGAALAAGPTGANNAAPLLLALNPGAAEDVRGARNPKGPKP